MENNRSFRRTVSRWTALPRPRASALIVHAAALVLLAAAHTPTHAAEGSPRIMQARHACAVVLGLDPSERPYDDCIRSLDRTASYLERPGLTAGNRSLCDEKGLSPGTSAFAVCVVQAEESPSSSGRDRAVVSAR